MLEKQIPTHEELMPQLADTKNKYLHSLQTLENIEHLTHKTLEHTQGDKAGHMLA